MSIQSTLEQLEQHTGSNITANQLHTIQKLEALFHTAEFKTMAGINNKAERDRRINEGKIQAELKQQAKVDALQSKKCYTEAYYEAFYSGNGRLSPALTSNGGWMFSKKKKPSFNNWRKIDWVDKTLIDTYSDADGKIDGVLAGIAYLFDNKDSKKNKDQTGLLSIYKGPAELATPASLYNFMQKYSKIGTGRGIGSTGGRITQDDCFKYEVRTFNGGKLEKLPTDTQIKVLKDWVREEVKRDRKRGIIAVYFIHLGEHAPHIHKIILAIKPRELTPKTTYTVLNPKYKEAITKKRNHAKLTQKEQEITEEYEKLLKRYKQLKEIYKLKKKHGNKQEKAEFQQIKEKLYITTTKTKKTYTTIGVGYGLQPFNREFIKEDFKDRYKGIKTELAPKINKKYGLDLDTTEEHTTLVGMTAEDNNLNEKRRRDIRDNINKQLKTILDNEIKARKDAVSGGKKLNQQEQEELKALEDKIKKLEKEKAELQKDKMEGYNLGKLDGKLEARIDKVHEQLDKQPTIPQKQKEMISADEVEITDKEMKQVHNGAKKWIEEQIQDVRNRSFIYSGHGNGGDPLNNTEERREKWIEKGRKQLVDDGKLEKELEKKFGGYPVEYASKETRSQLDKNTEIVMIEKKKDV